jgi:hypothetical protein
MTDTPFKREQTSELEAMSHPGATLQSTNNEIVKKIEYLREHRDALQKEVGVCMCVV